MQKGLDGGILLTIVFVTKLCDCDDTSSHILRMGSVPAEIVGQGEVGGFQHWAQMAWLFLDLAVESPRLALDGPFLTSFA